MNQEQFTLFMQEIKEIKGLLDDINTNTSSSEWTINNIETIIDEINEKIN
ncbi:hypothetical protein [[Acholeplasma] multilocale]|nr:hypothetical protein [[Acholeplasma] multilocale]